MPRFIIVLNNPVDGFSFYGPFADQDQAVAWAEEQSNDGNPWWAAPIEAPEPDLLTEVINAALAVVDVDGSPADAIAELGRALDAYAPETDESEED